MIRPKSTTSSSYSKNKVITVTCTICYLVLVGIVVGLHTCKKMDNQLLFSFFDRLTQKLTSDLDDFHSFKLKTWCQDIILTNKKHSRKCTILILWETHSDPTTTSLFWNSEADKTTGTAFVLFLQTLILSRQHTLPSGCHKLVPRKEKQK